MEQLINELKQKIDYIKRNNLSMDIKSWTNAQGVLISGEQAQLIIDLLKENK